MADFLHHMVMKIVTRLTSAESKKGATSMAVILLHALVKYKPQSKLHHEILTVFGCYQCPTKILIILQFGGSLEGIFTVRMAKGGQNALLKDLFVQGCLRVGFSNSRA